MRKFIRMLILVSTVTLTACAMGPQSTYTPQMSQLEMKCLAFASQAAQGAGGWTSVAPMRAAIYDNARAQYYQQCISAGGF